MPAWPGGPCPKCGDDMPENLIRCVSCRTLLNEDLEVDSVEIPVFVPLQEIECKIEFEPRGYYVGCPSCDKELRINLKYAGQKVSCKSCKGRFQFAPKSPELKLNAYYGTCPHCSEQLRIGQKYLGKKVACKLCQGTLQIMPVPQA